MSSVSISYKYKEYTSVNNSVNDEQRMNNHEKFYRAPIRAEHFRGQVKPNPYKHSTTNCPLVKVVCGSCVPISRSHMATNHHHLVHMWFGFVIGERDESPTTLE